MEDTSMSPQSPQVQRIAVAVSGSGRSLANFLKAQKTSSSFVVGAVIASRQDCYAVTIAKEHHIPVFFGSIKPEHLPMLGPALYDWLSEQNIDWIALAGFLKPFPTDEQWSKRVVNIHPALLPHYGGKGMYGDHVHAAVLANQDTRSGATVHFVNERYDDGAIIAQIIVPVAPDDTASTLAARVFAAECRLYPEVMDRLIRGELPLPQGEIMRIEHETP